ncbi:MAG TPA: efflux RND transporter periplasmic adaptor subunit, partial [Thauera sp.]|nr:efflux RND transporter periplasmic adaptor subunit [Thauera sp.]
MTAIAVGVAIAIGAGYGIAHLQNTGNAAPLISESQAQSDSAAPADGERKILYYRNPMGLPDTSPVPKKDSMGMDYIPV